MSQIQNSRRYTRQDIMEGKKFIESGEIPVRFANSVEYQEAFERKWDGGKIQDNQVYIDGKRVIAKEDINTILTETYLDPGRQGGRDKMHHRLLQSYIGISRTSIMSFLRNNEAHQLHQPLPRPSVQQASNTRNGFLHAQIDLIDMSTLAPLNNGHHWILTYIDKFTKFAYALPLKNKSGPVTLEGIKTILTKSPRFSKITQSDNGPEFKNRSLKNWLTQHNIKWVHSSSYHPQSNSVVERFNKSLKRMIYYHFTLFNTKKWNDVLPLLLENYNNAKHSSTGFTPIELQDAVLANQEIILEKARDRMRARAIKMLSKEAETPSIEIGDTVRIAATTMVDERKKTFRKDYHANYSKQLYLVAKISKGGAYSNSQYKITDLHSHPIRQRFYKNQLQKIDPELLITNKQSRPDYSKGAIWNNELHIKKIVQQGRQFDVILPEVEERQKNKRVVRKPVRLIDEILIQQHISMIKNKGKRTENEEHEENE